MEYKRAKYINQLKSRKNNGLIKIITGARRTGKSYILNELFYRDLLGSGVSSSHIIRFAFDADEDIDLLDSYYPNEPTKIKVKKDIYIVNAKKFRAYIKEKTNDIDEFFLLLDEVQLLENFVGTLNSFLKHKKFDVYVTGSNSKFLSKEIATEFKGRGSIIHVLPLVFSEYMEGTNLSPDKAWRDYIVYGGIPLVAQMTTEEEKVTYLKNLCEETYLKDIIARNGVKKTEELSDVFDILASVICSPVNISRITNTFESVSKKTLTDDTIDNFIGYFEEAFVLSKVKKYNIKGRKYIGSPFKMYFEDIGVRNARLNFRQIEETHLMENVLYNELRFKGYNVDVGEVNISEKTERIDVNGKPIYIQKALEVDFVASLGSIKYYIQSALSMDDDIKREQEKKSLNNIDDSFQKFVITKNGLNLSRDDKGIITMDLFDFLLNDEFI